MINTFVIHTRFFMAFKVLFAVAFLQLAVYTYTCIIANKKEVPHVSTMSEMEYTKVLMSVHDELGDEFKQLWMRDELESLRNELITAVNNAKKGDKYGSLFNEVLIKINDYVSRAMPSQDIIPALPGEYDQKKYEQLLENLNRALSQLKTQEEADRSFFKLLSEKYTEYKSSVDYIRRVVVKRLYKISPEFVCKKNSEGHIVCNSEGKPKILEDIMQKDVNGKYVISTRLLILKQFIKQFGWCEGVIHDKDARGEGYRCEKLRKEISEYRDRLEAAGELFDARGKEKNVISEFAATVDESIFDRFDYNARGRIKNYKPMLISDLALPEEAYELCWNMLKALERYGLIRFLRKNDPAKESDLPTVSFAFAGEPIIRLLLSEGYLFKLHTYYEALKSGFFDDVSMGVEVTWSEEHGTKNEIDVVLTKGFQTLTVECKATNAISHEFYHKLYSLPKTFGINTIPVLLVDSSAASQNDMEIQRGRKLGIETICDSSNIAQKLNDLFRV